MDNIDKLIKNAQKEIQKVEIQTIGYICNGMSGGKRYQIQKKSQQEVDQAKQSLLKNSSELKESLEGNFANKVSETFEKQKDMLGNI
ncbi:hypothetical protein AALM99_07005 [Lactococcus muris]|uniref:Uncharacterized protein n=1 Tax=Lactococcus muris TaxID=2941330 RepID=A0ABV4D8W2_9LACT